MKTKTKDNIREKESEWEKEGEYNTGWRAATLILAAKAVIPEQKTGLNSDSSTILRLLLEI